MQIARLSDSLAELSLDALFDRLCDLGDNHRRALHRGHEKSAAEYQSLIAKVCEEVKARGGRVSDWLDAAEIA